MTPREAALKRETRETQISVELRLDGGPIAIDTGLGFFDHMLTTLAHHGGLGLQLRCQGDLKVDDHHTVEDCCLALGSCLSEALGDRTGIVRFGHAYVPMDEALARSVVDLVSRPYGIIRLGFKREWLGDVACENLVHGLHSLSSSARITLHAEALYGENDHHRAEAAFKAVGRALKMAVTPAAGGAPSTKGVM